MHRRALSFVALPASAVVMAALAAAPAATAATPNPTKPTAVASSARASALHGHKLGATKASTKETLSFVFAPQNTDALSSSALSGSKSFLSVGAFADRYGQSPETIAELQSYLAEFGITTHPFANRLTVSASGTVAEFDAALDVTQSDYSIPAQTANGTTIKAQTVHSNTTAPRLPYDLAANLLGIFGLTDYQTATNHVQRVTDGVVAPKASKTGSFCQKLVGLDGACRLPSDFVKRYGASALQTASKGGAGQTIGILTFASLDSGAPEYFWKHYAKVTSGKHRTVTTVNVDGGSGKPSELAGTDETDLDVEQAGAIAPNANIRVYQAPNSDAGFVDVFFAAASENIASSVSISWGGSEDLDAAAAASGDSSPAVEQAVNVALEELAVQGQSTFTAAGDEGAYDAYADLGTTDPSVDFPSSSPYITSAGGTTLPLKVNLGTTKKPAYATVSTQRAWGWDYLWSPAAKVLGLPEADVAQLLIAGGGGGTSTHYAVPSYQQGVSGVAQSSAVQYLTPTDVENVAPGIDLPTAWSFTAKPAVSTVAATGRAVPDLSANADPYSGYLLYDTSAVKLGLPALEGAGGGTSFVSPQFAASAALMNALCGHRVGLWNPTLYTLSTSAVTPLSTTGTSNDNLLYTGTAGTRYNPATGLGTPNLTLVAKGLTQG